MAQIDSVDFANKRVYLHIDTVTQGFDPIAMHFELQALVAANATNGQNFGRATDALGNEPEGGGIFSEPKVRFFTGWRYVPFPTPHLLLILAKIYNPDEALSNRDLADRDDPVLNGIEVDIDVAYSPVEIREVQTGGGGLTPELEEIIRETREVVHSIQANNPKQSI